MPSPYRPYRPRRLSLPCGREVTLRAVVESDAAAIVRAFERLSVESRYNRFMVHKKRLNLAAVEQGVHRRPGQDFAFVATVPAGDGIDIVGAAQYVPADEGNAKTCEFAITMAEDWRGSGLAEQLLASLVRRARRDGYQTMEGMVMATNVPMLALARKLKFAVEPVPQDATVVRVQRTLECAKRRSARPRERSA